MKKVVTYSDLSWPLKVAAITGWIAAFFAVMGFIVGFVGALI